MRRTLLASLLILHALAHSAIGIWVSAGPLILLADLLWATAMVAYVFAAFGVLGMRRASVRWMESLMIATGASMLLLLRFLPLVGLLGMVVDVAVLATALEVARRDNRLARFPRRIEAHARPGALAHTAASVALVYVALVALLRPVYCGSPATAGARVPSILGLVTGPIEVFVYEPAACMTRRHDMREGPVGGQ